MKKILFAVLMVLVVVMGCTSTPPVSDQNESNSTTIVADDDNTPSPQPPTDIPVDQNDSNGPSVQTPGPTNPPVDDPTPSDPPVAGMTATELSTHNNANDCWVAYHGTVYDLTEWLTKHPGGSFAISPYCGTSQEFAEAFNRQHGTSKEKKLPMVGTEKGPYAG